MNKVLLYFLFLLQTHYVFCLKVLSFEKMNFPEEKSGQYFHLSEKYRGLTLPQTFIICSSHQTNQPGMELFLLFRIIHPFNYSFICLFIHCKEKLLQLRALSTASLTRMEKFCWHSGGA